MLSDRHYMRETQGERTFDPIHWLMGILAGLFLLEHVFWRWFHSPFLFDHFLFSVGQVRHGEIWTLLTYNFIQDIRGYTGGVLGLIFNLIILHYCGREIMERTSRRLFGLIYAGMILSGALAWTAAYLLKVYWPLYEASIAGAGLFTLFCCFHANERMTFLVFFLVPVTIKPKHFAWFWVALDLFGFAFYEMLGQPSPLWNGHSARLGAMLAAVVYFRYLHERLLYGLAFRPRFEPPRWLRRKKKPVASSGHKVNISDRRELREEVDRILDKINSQGFGALTEEEKRVLDEAKDMLSRR